MAVAGGRAAFLRPESATGSVDCPGGSLNATADADTDDQVVQLWESGDPVQSLDLAATAVALSATHVAALADEHGQGGTILNADGDAADQVVQVRAIGGGSWTNVGEAADTLAMLRHASSVRDARGRAERRPQRRCRPGRPRAADLEHRRRRRRSSTRSSAAEEFVCGDTLIAFRSPEAADGLDRNADGDTTDDVLAVYDMTTRPSCTRADRPSPRAVSAECDPAPALPRTDALGEVPDPRGRARRHRS